MEAERYLKYAARLKYEWAMLVLGNFSEKEDSEKAIVLYMDLPLRIIVMRKENWQESILKEDLHARPVQIVFLGYSGKCWRFWEALQNHYMAETGGGNVYRNTDCTSVGEKYKVERELAPKYIQMVQDVASKWQKGDKEPDFPNIQVLGQRETR